MKIENYSLKTFPPAWLGKLAVLPVYVMLALTLSLIWFSGMVKVSYESRLTAVLLNTLAVTGVSAATAWLAVRGYLASGLIDLLYAGCGLLAMGASFLISSLSIEGAQSPNDAVTVHNLGVLLASLFHLAAAVRAGQVQYGRSESSAPQAALACLGVLALTGLFWAVARYDLAPLFYTAEEGATPVRQLVLTLSIAFLAVAGAFLMHHATRRGSLALSCYGLGLYLIAIGLVDVSIAVPGSILSWTGRLSQSLGHVYLLAAFIIAIRTAVQKGFDVKAAAADYYIESESHYRAMVNALSAAIISLDSKERVVQWSPQAETLFGYAYAEAVGKRLTDLIAAEGGGRKAFRDLLEGLSGSYIEVTLCRKDREEFPAEALAFGAGAGLTQWTNLIIRDISDRKRVEEVLRRYELISAHSRDIILHVHYDTGRILEANAASVAAYGYSREELLNLTIRDLRASERLSQIEDQLAAAERKGILFESIHRRKDGSTFFAEVSSQGATIGGIRTLVSVIRDISERKAAEEALRKRELRLRQALHISRSFAFEWNPATDEVTRSEECGPLLGLHGDEAVRDSGHVYFQRVHPEDRERFAAMMGALTPERPSYTTKYRLMRPDGRVLVLEETGLGFFDTELRLNLLTGIATDITEREKSREEIAYLASFPRLNPNPITEVDLDGQVRFCNPTAEKLLPDLQQRSKDHSWLSDWGAVSQAIVGGGMDRLEREVAIGDQWYHQLLHFIPESRSLRIYGLDITGLKATERRLRENQADLNWAQSVGRIGSWRLNVERNELLWSDENHRIFGVPKGTPMSYETFLDIVHPEDRDYVNSKWTAALRGEPYEIEHRIIAGNLVKWVRERAELEFDAKGTLLGGFGTTQDVSDLKQAEKTLRHSEARFRLLADISAQLLATSDPQAHVSDLAGRVMEHLDCQCFFNYLLVDVHPGRLQLNACAGIPAEEARRIEWLDYGVAVCGCVARDGVRIVAEHIPTTPDVRTELVKSYGIKAYACHPLMGVNGRLFGTLSFGTRNRETFSEEDLELMKAVTDQVAVALVRMQNEKDLRSSAEALLQANEKLEVKVRQRTCELEKTVAVLKHENFVRNKLQTQLQQLSRKSLEALEADRRAVSRELHDSIGGSLAAIKFEIEVAAKQTRRDPANVVASLETINSHLADTIKETKRISANLRPLSLDDLGLLATIEWYIRQFCKQYESIRVDCQIDVEEREIPDGFKIVFYRVMQEALNNAARHSRADTVCIRMTKSVSHFEFEVEDNGCGFEVSEAFDRQDSMSGFGLKSMQERTEICGGVLTLNSRPGSGTSVKIVLPFGPAASGFGGAEQVLAGTSPLPG